MPFFRFFQQVYLTRTLEGLFELVRRPSRAPSLAWYHVQEAMESSAFPDSFDEIEICSQLMNIFCVPRNYAEAQQALFLFTGNIM